MGAYVRVGDGVEDRIVKSVVACIETGAVR
jgi:hypothetical protein